MHWVTRRHIRVNRTATAWLVRRFVPNAEARLRGEPHAVTENHFTPGTPRAFQLGIEYRLA